MRWQLKVRKSSQMQSSLRSTETLRICQRRSLRLTCVKECGNQKAEEYRGDNKAQEKDEDERRVTVLEDYLRYDLTKQSGCQFSPTGRGVIDKQGRPKKIPLPLE